MANLEVLALDTAVPQIRAPGVGDGYSVPRDMTMASGTTLSAQALSAAGNLTLSGGTANGVLYLNGSKVATSGSALTFDGTNLTATGTLTLGSSTEKVIINRLSDFTAYGLITFNGAFGSATGAGIYGRGSGGDSGSLYYNVPTGAAQRFQVNGDTKLILDSSGNLGLGVTPSAWSLGKAFEVGAVGNAVWGDAGFTNLLQNVIYSSGAYKYAANGTATRYDMSVGAHTWYTAPSGTAGNTITFTQALTLDANRNLLLNGTAAPASGVGTFAMFNGTAPTGSVTDGCVLYTEDVSSSSELKVRDEAGNVTTLSPHNFSLIPEGPSEDMAWSYYSERDGKRINIDMLKAIRVLEKLSGEKLVHES